MSVVIVRETGSECKLLAVKTIVYLGFIWLRAALGNSRLVL